MTRNGVSSEKPVAIVVARMTSSRLPGKVLTDLHGRPLLAYLLERLHHCSVLDRLCVATSTDPTDDAISEFCEEIGEFCVRGSLSDVAARLLQAANELDVSLFFRANADSPFLPTDLYLRAYEVLRLTHADIVTNVSPRTLPPGASVELIRVEALSDALSRFASVNGREHVTGMLYSHPDRYHIERLSISYRFPPNLRLAVDTLKDLDFARDLLSRMTRPHWDYTTEEILELARGLV
jgi:spore coat polysaccharide biosynthesis protein SpsF